MASLIVGAVFLLAMIIASVRGAVILPADARIPVHAGHGRRGAGVEVERISIAFAQRDGEPHVLPRLVVERRLPRDTARRPGEDERQHGKRNRRRVEGRRDEVPGAMAIGTSL